MSGEYYEREGEQPQGPSDEDHRGLTFGGEEVKGPTRQSGH